MKIIKEITDKCFNLNALAADISPATTIGELNHIRKEIESLRVMSRGLRIDMTPVDMVEMTMNSKLHDAMYSSDYIPTVRMRTGLPPIVFNDADFVIKYRMAE